jgi:hypothetical protein
VLSHALFCQRRVHVFAVCRSVIVILIQVIMSSVYDLPIPPSRQVPHSRTSHNRKRKWRHTGEEDEEPENGLSRNDEAASVSSTSSDEEYSAVVSPQERVQRRLAHLSLKKPLPPPPFPHRGVGDRQHPSTPLPSIPGHDSQSLRKQHISTLTAVLQKCCANKDWARARRAIGLLLRTALAGRPVDIRAGEYWAIAAEVLFRQSPDPGTTFSRAGFSEAQAYYEKLIVRHPHSVAAPESVNAVDFYLAMFSLWIFVAQSDRQSWTLGEEGGPNAASPPHEMVRQELSDAVQIKARMDKCMSTAPYADNKHFQVLKTSIERWHADLEDEMRTYSTVPLDDTLGIDNENTSFF